MKMMGGGSYENSNQYNKTTLSLSCFSSNVAGGMGGPTPLFYCSCEKIAVVRIARTAANYGRPYFSCPLMKDEVGCCGYFLWCDEAPNFFVSNGNNVSGCVVDVEVKKLKDQIIDIHKQQRKVEEDILKMGARIEAVMLAQNQ